MHTDIRKPLKEIFKAAAQAYHRAYPQVLKHFVVYSKSGFVYVSPPALERMEDFDTEKEALQVLKEDMEASGYPAYAHRIELDDPHPAPVNAVLLDLRYRFCKSAADSRSQKMASVFVLDHEIGHFVVRRGIPGFTNQARQHLRECAADAYAALMHIKRFGGITDGFWQIAGERAGEIVYGSRDHYTRAVFSAVAQVAERTNVAALSMPDIERLAGRVARRYHYSTRRLNKIRHAFSAARHTYAHAGSLVPKVFTDTAKAMLQHRQDSDIYRAGKLLLASPAGSRYLESGTRFWRGVRQAMATHEQQHRMVLDPASALDTRRRALALPVKSSHSK